MKLRSALGIWFATAALDQGMARLLDSMGLIEGLLSPADASPPLLLPLAAVFYAARFVARFVAPGLVLGALAARMLCRFDQDQEAV